MTVQHKNLMIERLKAGQTIYGYKEGGNSMVPLIYSREPVDISPVNTDLLEKDDIVFCKVNGKFYTHKVTALQGDRVQISNNHGFVNGWTTKDNIFGIITGVSDRVINRALSKVRVGE